MSIDPEAGNKRLRPSRVLGMDYGLARIGVAISDERKIIATPILTIKTEKKLELTASKIVHELQQLQIKYGCDIETILIGIPLRMNGQLGMMADEVKHFVDVLKQLVAIPIVLWDERLSSVQADRSLREGNMTRKRRSQVVDTVTAAIILQSYLDSKIT